MALPNSSQGVYSCRKHVLSGLSGRLFWFTALSLPGIRVYLNPKSLLGTAMFTVFELRLRTLKLHDCERLCP